MTIKKLQEKFLPHLAPEDFFILLSHATGKEKTYLLAHPEFELDDTTLAETEEFFSRRLKHEPIAYITGEKEFYGLSFKVDNATLIPRPETELLVEKTLSLLSSSKTREWDLVDVGTGSGAIILSLANALSHSRFSEGKNLYGIDISKEALFVAKENLKHQKPPLPVTFFEGNLLEPYIALPQKQTSLLVLANLPYLSEDLYLSAPPDVREYEPKTALLSDNHGLKHSFELLSGLWKLRGKQSVSAFFEISPEQAPLFQKHLEENFKEVSFERISDLSGKERFVFVSF